MALNPNSKSVAVVGFQAHLLLHLEESFLPLSSCSSKTGLEGCPLLLEVVQGCPLLSFFLQGSPVQWKSVQAKYAILNFLVATPNGKKMQVKLIAVIYLTQYIQSTISSTGDQ